MSIYHTYFQQLNYPCWILDNDYHVIERNHAAKLFEEGYCFDLKKIVEISTGQGCALHATKSACLNCPIDHQWQKAGYPLTLLDNQKETSHFWVNFVRVEKTYFLEIKEAVSKDHEINEHVMWDYLNEARENERKKIAQDLHEGIAQSLYSLMLETRGLKWTQTADMPEKLQEIDQHFVDLLKEIKNLATDLRPAALDDLGLIPAVQQFILRTREMTGFNIELAITGEIRALSKTIEVVVYRLIQEAVSNALKYSGENDVLLAIDYLQQSLNITISDQGIGFAKDEMRLGFGILNMKERVAAVNGELIINSAKNQGTKIHVSIPYEEE